MGKKNDGEREMMQLVDLEPNLCIMKVASSIARSLQELTCLVSLSCHSCRRDVVFNAHPKP